MTSVAIEEHKLYQRWAQQCKETMLNMYLDMNLHRLEEGKGGSGPASLGTWVLRLERQSPCVQSPRHIQACKCRAFSTHTSSSRIVPTPAEHDKIYPKKFFRTALNPPHISTPRRLWVEPQLLLRKKREKHIVRPCDPIK